MESSLSWSGGGSCLYRQRTDNSSLEAGEPSGYERELWSQAAQIQIPASLFTSCGSLGKLSSLSTPSFLICEMGMVLKFSQCCSEDHMS